MFSSDVPLSTTPMNTGQIIDVFEAQFEPTNPLVAHSRRPFFYWVSPHENCGCLFREIAYEEDYETGQQFERPTPAQLAAFQGLAEVLKDALRHQASVEVFTFVSGDEATPPETRRQATPDDFLTDRSLFDMWQMIIVSATNITLQTKLFTTI
jgi:hypothetical protein